MKTLVDEKNWIAQILIAVPKGYYLLRDFDEENDHISNMRHGK